MTFMQHTENIAARNSGTLMTLILMLQIVVAPLLGWMFLKLDTIQANSSQAQATSAVFGDRQKRQSQDILDIKNTLKGVETIDAAKEARKKIWQTDQDQYGRLNTLRERQNKIESRVQRLETERGSLR